MPGQRVQTKREFLRTIRCERSRSAASHEPFAVAVLPSSSIEAAGEILAGLASQRESGAQDRLVIGRLDRGRLAILCRGADAGRCETLRRACGDVPLGSGCGVYLFPTPPFSVPGTLPRTLKG
jgi:hypothetical protein